MKAAYFEQHGPPDVIQVGDLPDPEVGPGEVRVRVRAAALNHLDLWVRRGIPGLDLPLPHIGGSDVAGEVESVGPGVVGWSVGDRVIVNPALWCDECAACRRGDTCLCRSFHIVGEHVPGGFAELVVVPARNLYRIGGALDWPTAAAAPLTFQTAWRALVTRGRLAAGEVLLVTGASGGVSTAAMQIGRHLGARVFGLTSGADNVSRVEALGAERGIDRLAEDLLEVLGAVRADVVLDSVGEAIWGPIVRSLAVGGRLVTYGATTGPRVTIDLRHTFWKQLEFMGSTMATQAEFEQVMNLVDAGTLTPVVHDVRPLEDLAEVQRELEAGQMFGKVVVVP